REFPIREILRIAVLICNNGNNIMVGAPNHNLIPNEKDGSRPFSQTLMDAPKLIAGLRFSRFYRMRGDVWTVLPSEQETAAKQHDAIHWDAGVLLQCHAGYVV